MDYIFTLLAELERGLRLIVLEKATISSLKNQSLRGQGGEFILQARQNIWVYQFIKPYGASLCKI